MTFYFSNTIDQDRSLCPFFCPFIDSTWFRGNLTILGNQNTKHHYERHNVDITFTNCITIQVQEHQTHVLQSVGRGMTYSPSPALMCAHVCVCVIEWGGGYLTNATFGLTGTS